MKKTKLFTSIAALALVLGLGACELPEETTSEESGVTTETDTTVETDTGNESTTSEETSEGGTTSETTSEGGNTSETTSEGGNEGDEGEEDETYLFGFELDDTLNYIDGGTIEGYSYEGTFTTNVDDAVRVKVESTETAGEYYLSYELNETTYWITIIENNGYTNLSYATEAAPLYWNATYNCWGDNTLSYFLCYYKNEQYSYECLYCSALTYVSSSPIAGLYTEDGVAYTEGLVGYELPAPTSITVTGATELEEGKTTVLTATIEPTNADQDITWSSSTEANATVNQNGVVTGVLASDTPVTITATSTNHPEIYGSIQITIIEKSSEIPEGLIGTYEFENAGRTTNNSSVATTAVDSFFKTEGVYVAGNTVTNPYVSCTNATKIGLGADGSGGLLESHNCFKLGTGSAIGEATLTFSESVSKVVVYATAWNASNTAGTLVINDISYSMTQTAAQLTDVSEITPTTYTLTSAATTLNFATVANAYRVCIYAMELYSA